MDAFFASVELLTYPELRGQAVVVGGRNASTPVTNAQGDKQFLRLRDYAGRGVVTTSTVNTKKDGFLSWDLFGDFRKRTMFKGARCTEKVIRELHQQALDVSDLTMSEAAAHYEKKDAVTV